MTNYITAVGVQQVSITIANGATTGTATINAVGAGAFILFQGYTCTETANLNDSMSRVALTNSTTVTASRGVTGSSKSCVVNAVVIDGDTTNLIKSVQTGTISLSTGQTSNTASISAVTNNNTAIAWLGTQASTTGSSLSNDNVIISLSGTTVTATRQFSGIGITVGYCVIEFQGTALNSAVQNVAHSATPNAATSTSTITSVTTGNTMLIYGGFYGNNSSDESQVFQQADLTNATTITFTTGASSFVALKCNVCVVEFAAGVLNQSVQRGTIALTAATSNTATITSSSATSGFCNWLWNKSTATAFNSATTNYRITQTNATTLTMNVNTSATGAGSYEVVEFPAFSGTAVIGTGLHGIDGGFVADYGGVPTIDPGMHKIDDGISLENDNEIEMRLAA